MVVDADADRNTGLDAGGADLTVERWALQLAVAWVVEAVLSRKDQASTEWNEA